MGLFLLKLTICPLKYSFYVAISPPHMPNGKTVRFFHVGKGRATPRKAFTFEFRFLLCCLWRVLKQRSVAEPLVYAKHTPRCHLNYELLKNQVIIIIAARII